MRTSRTSAALLLLQCLALLLAGPLLGAAFAWENIQFAKDRAVQDYADVLPPDLDGGDINDASTRIYEKLGIGNAKTDKGVLLLMALDDRKVWIEVGYGSEPVLTDATASDIYRNTLVPAFRAGRYADGIDAAVGRILAVLSGDEEATPAGQAGDDEQWGRLLPFAGFLLFFIIAGFNSSNRGGRGGGERSNRRARHYAGPVIFGGGGRGWSGGGGGFSGGGFGGFGGGMSGGGGAGGGW